MHKPPIAKRVPVTSVRHGREVVDEYAWLRDRDDPDTVAYLEAENAHTDEWFAPLADLQEQLFEEIKSRILETDMSVPARRGPWWYVTRTEEGKQYSIFCRRPERDAVEGEAGADRQQRARRRSRVLRARRARRQPEPSPARVLDRRHRSRGLHHPHPRPRHRHRPARHHRRHAVRHRLVGRRPLPLLHTARRRVAFVPDLAPRGRHRRQRRRARLPGGRHPLRRRPLQHAQRSVHRDHDREPDDERGQAARRDRSARRSSSRRAALARARVQRRSSRRPAADRHEPGRGRLPTRRSPDRQRRARPRGTTFSPIGPARGCSASTRSPITSSPTSGPTRCPPCG